MITSALPLVGHIILQYLLLFNYLSMIVHGNNYVISHWEYSGILLHSKLPAGNHVRYIIVLSVL